MVSFYSYTCKRKKKNSRGFSTLKGIDGHSMEKLFQFNIVSDLALFTSIPDFCQTNT